MALLRYNILKMTFHRLFRHDIHEFLKRKSYELKNEVSVKADFYQSTSGMEYNVRCQVIEQGLPLIDLT